jgi:lycopene beta-cyclase
MHENKDLDYDIIICGGGLAGLSLSYIALKTSIWTSERILIIEQDRKEENDRLWSFWESGRSIFEHIVYRQWTNLKFFSNAGKLIDIDHAPYVYKMIRSSDFYRTTKEFLKTCPNVHFLNEKITKVVGFDDSCEVTTESHFLRCKYAFSSIYQKPELYPGQQYFLQHFKGVKIRSEELRFDLSTAWLMDFRTEQEHGATFFYTLPMSHNEIFVEYTFFSKKVLSESDYDAGIHEYIKSVLKLQQYEILESEMGAIPMTNYHFQRRSGNLIFIGTAGGDTRASTGYTFTNLQKTITNILSAYKASGSPVNFKEHHGILTSLYDGTLLQVMDASSYPPHQIFTDLFEHTDGKSIFKFLDAESSIFTDFKIMKSLRTWPFLKAFAKELWLRCK